MKIQFRVIFIGICALLIAARSSEPPSQTIPDNETKKSSLFERDTSADTNPPPYQVIYPGNSVDTDSLILGLDAAMTGDFAKSGVSIWRGMVLAVDEINKDGGVLGHNLQIVVKNHQTNPARGVENIKQFASMDRLLAVMGGMHTPVMLKELEAIHENNLISLVPWAAGTPIVDNDYDPNHVFRLSVRDEYAGPFLVRKLIEAGYDNPALFLEQTGWGRSNRAALTEALQQQELSPALISWFNWSEKNFHAEIGRARAEEADIIVFVGNAPEGATLIESMAKQKPANRLPILSHWGITGGNFFEETQSSLPKVQLRVLQTRSFLDPANPDYARAEIQAYCKKFDCGGENRKKILAPVGSAHAHDLVHLFSKAVEKTGTIHRPAIRNNLENLSSWEGIVRKYDRPFTKHDHEALTINDLRLAQYDTSGMLVLGDRN